MQGTVYKYIIRKVREYVNLGIILQYSWDSTVQEIKKGSGDLSCCRECILSCFYF